MDENISKLIDYIWNDDQEEDGRENLGNQMPVEMYRLFQYTLKDVLEKRYDKKTAIEILRDTGEEAGRLFARKKLNLKHYMQNACHFLKA